MEVKGDAVIVACDIEEKKFYLFPKACKIVEIEEATSHIINSESLLDDYYFVINIAIHEVRHIDKNLNYSIR